MKSVSHHLLHRIIQQKHAIRDQIFSFLPGVEVVHICEALATPEPKLNNVLPTRLVMVPTTTCTLCDVHAPCRTLYLTTVLFHMGWICCSACFWKASLHCCQYLRKHRLLVAPSPVYWPPAVEFPHIACDPAAQRWSIPVQFYRHRIRRIQTKAHLLIYDGYFGNYNTEHLHVMLFCVFGPHYELVRSVSLPNLIYHNRSVFYGSMLTFVRMWLNQEGMTRRLDCSTKRWWVQRIVHDYQQARALHLMTTFLEQKIPSVLCADILQYLLHP
jgi:hypothetical protein